MKKYQIKNFDPFLHSHTSFLVVSENPKDVECFISSFHEIGCGKLDNKYEDEYSYTTIRELYCFWRENGFVTKKQVYFLITLIDCFQEHIEMY